MDKREAIEKVSLFIEAVVDEYNPSQIILFGSYARGTQSESSDIDVAVVVESIEGDLLDKKARLFKIRRSIDCSIEPILLEKAFETSGFLEEILSYGEVLYTKSA